MVGHKQQGAPTKVKSQEVTLTSGGTNSIPGFIYMFYRLRNILSSEAHGFMLNKGDLAFFCAAICLLNATWNYDVKILLHFQFQLVFCDASILHSLLLQEVR